PPRCGPPLRRFPLARGRGRVRPPERARYRAEMRARGCAPFGEALRLPDLELEPLPYENCSVGDPDMGDELFRQHHATVRVDLQDAALAIESRGKALVVLRERRKDVEALRDRLA